MHGRAARIALIAVLGVTLVAPTALAQVTASVQQTDFSWTGKDGQQANFQWSATVDNPAGRDIDVEVTFEFLDDANSVIASDSEILTVAEESQAQVERTGMISVADAKKAKNYRIVLAKAPEED